MNKFQYQNLKFETNPNFPNSNAQNTLNFVFLSFKFVSNLALRISHSLSQRGQALITLIFFVLIAVTITSGAIIMLAVNSSSFGKFQEGNVAYYSAESGIENAILRVIRDSLYTGETLVADGLNVAITVTGVNPKIVTAESSHGNFKRKVKVEMNYNSGYYNIGKWKEI